MSNLVVFEVNIRLTLVQMIGIASCHVEKKISLYVDYFLL